jgi:hypothetical protein
LKRCMNFENFLMQFFDFCCYDGGILKNLYLINISIIHCATYFRWIKNVLSEIRENNRSNYFRVLFLIKAKGRDHFFFVVTIARIKSILFLEKEVFIVLPQVRKRIYRERDREFANNNPLATGNIWAYLIYYATLATVQQTKNKQET